MLNGPVRIFHIAGSGRWAGGERLILQMGDHLDPHVFPMAVALPERGPLEGELRRRHIPFEVVPLSPMGNPLPIRALSRLFREWKPDIVQGHGAQSNFYARLAAGRVRCVSTIHNAISDYPVRAWRKGLYSVADRLTARRSAAVVCVAECLREDFLRRCPSVWERTHVIPNGVDLDRYDPKRYSRDLARRTFELGDRWTILLPGRLAVGKGHAQLLEAAALIRNILPPFRILFAGEGPLVDILRKKSRSLGMEECVVFLGLRNDIPELLAAADVVVLPSVAEGLPAALLEALAMEEPVIASDVTGVSEVMPSGDEGYRVPPGSVEKLSETLLRVLWDKEDARRHGEAGRRRVQREYDLNKTLSKWEGLYRQLSGDFLIE